MHNILVIRNDKIGDFMVTWPAFALLKQSLPNSRIVALVPPYTAPLAQSCPYIDEIILDSPNKKDKNAYQQVLQAVKKHQFSAVISFVSDWYNAKLVWQSGIPYRLAPATKLFQFLYNHRLTQRRSRSEKAESAYNLDLAQQFLRDQQIAPVAPRPPYWQFSPHELHDQREKLTACLGLDPAKKWVFIHSGTGGTASSLSLSQFRAIGRAILAHFDCQLVLTAGPSERAQANALAEQIQGGQKVVVYDQNDGLVDFSRSLACASLFISGSTGPMHICGALNIPTIGFFPSRLSAIPRRWQPINDPDKHLAFCPPSDKASQLDLTRIDITHALTDILPFIERCWRE